MEEETNKKKKFLIIYSKSNSYHQLLEACLFQIRNNSKTNKPNRKKKTLLRIPNFQRIITQSMMIRKIKKKTAKIIMPKHYKNN
jgi:galactose-1-phosphate uridylyltransferase